MEAVDKRKAFGVSLGYNGRCWDPTVYCTQACPDTAEEIC